eukprot:jgi/Bigna1/78512/fgenesh1_pg.55_\
MSSSSSAERPPDDGDDDVKGRRRRRRSYRDKNPQKESQQEGQKHHYRHPSNLRKTALALPQLERFGSGSPLPFVQHLRSHTMPQHINPLGSDSETELPHIFEEFDSLHEGRDSFYRRGQSLVRQDRYPVVVKRNASICVGGLGKGSAPSTPGDVTPRLSLNFGSSNRNLLVDLDKIEKTVGKAKVRRRNSITVGELYEARELCLEDSRHGVLHSSLVHQEWRRNRFQALYQAMKRRKMLARLKMRQRVPEEVDKEHLAREEEDVRTIAAQAPNLSSYVKTPVKRTCDNTREDVLFSKLQSIRGGGGDLRPEYKLTEGSASRSSIDEKVLLAATKVKLAAIDDADKKKEAAGMADPKGRRSYGGSGCVFLNSTWRERRPRQSKVNVFDPPLSERGFRQASEVVVAVLAMLGQRLKSEGITHIIASPFTRTIQTAIEVAKHLNLKVTCRRLQLDPNVFQVTVNTHKDLLKRFQDYISPERNLREIKLNKWPAVYPEEEEQLFDRTNNTVKHIGLFAHEYQANVLLVSHQVCAEYRAVLKPSTPVEYMAFELSDQAEDKFVSVCCLTKASPRKNNPKKKGWKLLFQHDDSFLSEPECGHKS